MTSLSFLGRRLKSWTRRTGGSRRRFVLPRREIEVSACEKTRAVCTQASRATMTRSADALSFTVRVINPVSSLRWARCSSLSLSLSCKYVDRSNLPREKGRARCNERICAFTPFRVVILFSSMLEIGAVLRTLVTRSSY